MSDAETGVDSVTDWNERVRDREKCEVCDASVPESDASYRFAAAGGALAGPFCSRECYWTFFESQHQDDVDRGDDIATDGGEAFLDSSRSKALGLVENALAARDAGQWERARRLVQQVLADLDHESTESRLLRSACTNTHPRDDTWGNALRRAQDALEPTRVEVDG